MSICSGVLHNCVSVYKKPCKELQEKLVALIQEGIPLIRAMEIYLIDPSDFAAMKVLATNGDEELLAFAHRCLLAETSFEITLVRTAIKNPNAAAKLLENRFAHTWKSYSESDIEKMNPKELQQFIDNQERKNLMIDITSKAADNEG
jgi:hypothetical protein